MLIISWKVQASAVRVQFIHPVVHTLDFTNGEVSLSVNKTETMNQGEYFHAVLVSESKKSTLERALRRKDLVMNDAQEEVRNGPRVVLGQRSGVV